MKIKKNEIVLNRTLENLLKFILILSVFFFTFLLSNGFDLKHTLIGCMLSSVILSFVVFKFMKIDKLSIKRLCISSFIGLYIIKVLLLFSSDNAIYIESKLYEWFSISINSSYIKILLGLFSIFAVMYFVYLFILFLEKFLKDFWKSLTKVEKRYLKIIFMVAVFLSILITLLTSAFSIPVYEDKVIIYDVLYTSDSGYIVQNDAFLNVSNLENDIRQPLFGIFSFPFAIIAKFISDFCFFLPDDKGYAIVLTIIQFMLTSISTILIGKMLKLEEKHKKYLYLLFSLSFPYMIFNLILEQYVMGIFYLILTIYCFFENKFEINYMYIGAVGTLVTSGILFPFITKFKNIKNWLCNCFKCFCGFLSVLIIGGQFPQLFLWWNKFNSLIGSFTGKVLFTEKLYQFTNFVSGLFFSEHGSVHFSGSVPTYQLIKFTSLNIVGVAILFLVILSFLINRKNKMACVSFVWVLFSFFVLFVMGWGMQENGLILYSLYFAWSYFILIFLLLKKLFKNKVLFTVSMSVMLFIMLWTNFGEVVNILKFAFRYY